MDSGNQTTRMTAAEAVDYLNVWGEAELKKAVADRSDPARAETTAVYPPEVAELIEAMDQVLDDMGPSGLGVCLATKAMARVAFEPFLDPECREFVMTLERAQEILREVGL